MFRKLIIPASILTAIALVAALTFASNGGDSASAGVAVTTTAVSGTSTAPSGTSTVVRTSTAVRTSTVVRTTTAVATFVPTGTPSVGGKGCTPGFWKTHTGLAKYPNAWPPTGYSSGQTVGSVFAVPFPTLANATLADGLAFQGGNTVEEKSEILLRAAIAAVLNAAHPGVDYPMSVQGIVGTVNAALASSDGGTIVALAGALDSQNNLGCPINGK